MCVFASVNADGMLNEVSKACLTETLNCLMEYDVPFTIKVRESFEISVNGFDEIGTDACNACAQEYRKPASWTESIAQRRLDDCGMQCNRPCEIRRERTSDSRRARDSKGTFWCCVLRLFLL